MTHITVHDEIDVSVPKSKEGIEAAKELAHLMSTAVSLRVPMKADPDVGNNWGSVGEFELESIA